MENNSLDLISANKLLPKRDPYGNKGTFGRVLLICGSKKMIGCCVLAAKGALRSGAGLVTVAFPDVLYNSLTSQLNETLFLPLPTDERGFISHLAVPDVLDEAKKADVIMVGCGIGVDYGPFLVTASVLNFKDKPVIIDADGINNIAPYLDLLRDAQANILLTPHPGEMARLAKCSVEDIEIDREKEAADFAKKYNVNVLLKGHETIVVDKNGDRMYINKTGNSGLSKGGAGDLLSGIIAGLTPAFNGDVFTAAVFGAYVHGLSVDVLKRKFSEYSILPTDCADALPEVYKLIEECDNN